MAFPVTGIVLESFPRLSQWREDQQLWNEKQNRRYCNDFRCHDSGARGTPADAKTRIERLPIMSKFFFFYLSDHSFTAFLFIVQLQKCRIYLKGGSCALPSQLAKHTISTGKQTRVSGKNRRPQRVIKCAPLTFWWNTRNPGDPPHGDRTRLQGRKMKRCRYLKVTL